MKTAITLRKLREENHMTIREVSNKLNMSYIGYLCYELGTRRAGLEQVLVLSTLLDAPAEEVIQAQLNSCKFGKSRKY